MFHRVRSETPPAQPQSQPQRPSHPAQAQSQQQRPLTQPNQNSTPTSSAAPQNEAPRFDEFRQNPAAEQSRAPAKEEKAETTSAASSHNQTSTTHNTQPQTSSKEDAPTMTNPTQNNAPNSAEDYSAPKALDIPVSPYQRPGQAPVRAGAGYPGAYPAAAYPSRAGAPGGTAAPALVVGDRKLMIGRGISISGEIESCDHLVVEGTVEAALKGASVLEIVEAGTFYGTVDIEEATIAGRFEGDITVHGRLTIRSTGTITGSIAYKELEVESGAVIDGRLTPVGAASERKNTKGEKKVNKPHGKDNNDGELFNTKAAAE